jgi:hypothetical protein
MEEFAMRQAILRTSWLLTALLAVVAGLAEVSSAQQESVPAGIPQQAFSALLKAKQWRQDAVLVMVEVNDYAGNGAFTTQFSFYSPSNQTGLWVITGVPGGSVVKQAGAVNWGTQALPVSFLDLPAALQKARAKGMQGKMDHAMLRVVSGGPAWEIAPSFDPNLRVYTISATVGLSSLPTPTQPPPQTQPGSDHLILAGQRIGPVSLGMTIGETLGALGLAQSNCNRMVVNGDDGGQSSCDFEQFGLSMTFFGQIGTALVTRKAIWIAVEGKHAASRSYVTDRGIRIGSSDQEVLKAYGNAEKKETAFQEHEMVYSSQGIIFTFGGFGNGSEKLPNNIVDQIAIVKPER